MSREFSLSAMATQSRKMIEGVLADRRIGIAHSAEFVFLPLEEVRD